MWTAMLHFQNSLNCWVESENRYYALRRSGIKTSCGKGSRVVVTAPLWSLRATRVRTGAIAVVSRWMRVVGSAA